MSRWFRHYAGMMRDDKLVRVAIKTKQPVERVLWVWGAILESAAEIDDFGKFDFDQAEAAYFLRAKPATIAAIFSALEEAGHIADNAVSKWKSRQFQSDKSKDRVAAHRAKKRSVTANDVDQVQSGNAGVTLQGRHCNAPETETETEKKKPSSNEEGAAPDKIFWDRAKPYIGGKNPGGLIGKWCRDHGKEPTKRAITEAQAANAVDPVPYVERVLRRAKTAESMPVC